MPGLEIFDLQALAAEELDPELERYHVEDEHFGHVVKHPLVTSIGPLVSGLLNLQLREKQKAVAEGVERKDWGRVVAMHERPWRLDALLRFAYTKDEHGHFRPVWEQTEEVKSLTNWVWTDSENINQERERWLRVFRDRPDGAVLGDREAFDALPDPVPLYRGGDGPDSFLSWTTSREVAKFFARRFSPGDTPLVMQERMIPKADIFAYYTHRNEYEALSFIGMG